MLFYLSILWRSFYDRMIFPSFVLDEKPSAKKLISTLALFAMLCSCVPMMRFLSFLSAVPVQSILENVPEVILEEKGIVLPEKLQFSFNTQDHFFIVDTTNSEVQVPEFGYGVFLGKDHFTVKSGYNVYSDYYSSFVKSIKAKEKLNEAIQVRIPRDVLIQIYPQVLSKTKYIALLIGGVMIFLSEFIRLFFWMIILRSFTRWLFYKHKVYLPKDRMNKVTILSMTPWIVLNQVGHGFGASLSVAVSLALCLAFFLVFTLYWLKEVKTAQMVLDEFIKQAKKK